jgi:erythromycin esterase
MSSSSRRGFVLGGASVVLASGAGAKAGPRDPLQAWLETKAVRVRAIDAEDEDFADLEPLGDAIESARAVQLGEPSHGSGSAFSAKARIVKFLHKRLGFDVLIWESGLYDVALAQAAMRSSDDGVAAASKGVFSLWTAAAEVKPMFDYVKASQATLRPLEIAGFDMQITAKGTTERFARCLRAFASDLRDPALCRRAAMLSDQAIAARDRLLSSKFADAGDLEALTTAIRGLRQMISTRRADFESVHGALETSFMDRAIENARADAALRFDAERGPTTTERENRRDALNAANLRWLLEERYAGRKAIVWAHNAHIMNAYYAPDFRDVRLEPRQGDMKPTGVFLKGWLRETVYTLGMTTFEGEEGLATGGPATPIAPAPEGSLEAGLHVLGAPYVFVDFRRSKADRRSSMPSPQTVRIPKFATNTISEVSRVYDGLFFIDRMSRATHA